MLGSDLSLGLEMLYKLLVECLSLTPLLSELKWSIFKFDPTSLSESPLSITWEGWDDLTYFTVLIPLLNSPWRADVFYPALNLKVIFLNKKKS